MVQPTVARRNLKLRPSGTLGGGKNGLLGDMHPEKELPGMHVKSAKQLRETFIELQSSPDGMDPDPFTIPKVVECGHCGWPVYPRDSKVATKKTFARAGIERGTKKDEGAKTTTSVAAEDDEDAGSQDSRNTEERLRDELEDLQERVEELERDNTDLKQENEDLTEKVQELNATIEEQFDRIEFLEEAEEKWREKLMQAELRNEELVQFLERSGMIAADRERGLVCALEEIERLRGILERVRRRRALMLLALEQRYKKGGQEDYLAIVFRLWRIRSTNDKLTREAEDLEQSRKREVGNMLLQVQTERARVAALEAGEMQLKGRLRAAAQRLLVKALGSGNQPSTKAHVMQVWNGTTPLLAKEKALESTTRQLEETTSELEAVKFRFAHHEEAYSQVCDERDRLLCENADQRDQIEFLTEEGAGKVAAVQNSDLEARRQERKRELEDLKQQLEQALTTLAIERKQYEQEKADSEQEIEALESRLEVAEAAAMSGTGNAVPEVDEASRIVPKGQGVLCCGCLKQLVHRGVRPLPPVNKLPDAADERLERAKTLFFQKELGGMPGTDDAVHKHLWRARKDPYGIARLTLWPRLSQTKGLGASASHGSLPTSPSGAGETARATTPKLGLPELKMAHKLRGEGVASPLRSSMRDFRPKFRM